MAEFKAFGARTTDKYLVLHFNGRAGTVIRHDTVRIPLEDLVLSAQVTEALDRAARRALIEYWSGVDIPEEPLF